MHRQPIVIVDADAIIAQVNVEDFHHSKATQISQKLIELRAQVIYPITAVMEAATHMQRVLNSTASAFGTAQLMCSQEVQVIEVNQRTLTNALRYFDSTTSKKNTLFDCTVAAIADEYQADAIFSFDKFYVKKGFKLAEKL